MYLAVIPARGGSKGLPGKNIKMLMDKPLIAWSIEAAQQSRCIDRFIVSTDSGEIAAISKKYGADVLIRPDNLAADDTTTIEVLRHISGQISGVTDYVLLQPTSPLRNKGLIDSCIEKYKSDKYTNLATGYYCKYKEFGTHNNMRRQDYQGFFYDDGSVYILSAQLVEKGLWYGSNICRYENEKYQSFEIDDEVDFVIMDALMNKYKQDI